MDIDAGWVKAGANENFELSRMEIKTERKLSFEEEVIWVDDKSNNLYLLWNEKRREGKERERYLQNNSSDRYQHHTQQHFPTMIVFLVERLTPGTAMTGASTATEEQAHTW